MRKYDPEIHPGTIRMAEYIRAITTAGSVHPIGDEFVSPVGCRRKIGGRLCKGKLRIVRRSDVIEWCCTKCGVGGTVTAWRGGDCDMSEHAIPLDTAGMLKLYISEREYNTLKGVMMYTGEQEAIVAGAVWTGDEVLLHGSYAGFDSLADALAFEVNHSRGAKQMALNDVCEVVEMLVERARRRRMAPTEIP